MRAIAEALATDESVLQLNPLEGRDFYGNDIGSDVGAYELFIVETGHVTNHGIVIETPTVLVVAALSKWQGDCKGNAHIRVKSMLSGMR